MRWPIGEFPWLETLLLVGTSAVFNRERIRLIAANALGLTFVIIQMLGGLALIGQGITPATSLKWACWFTLAGAHAALVLGGAISTGWLGGPAYRMSVEDQPRFVARVEWTRRYWLFLDFGWLLIVAGFYLL